MADKPVDLQEQKARINGSVTPQSLSENLLEKVKKGEIDSVVYVTVDKEGLINAGYTDGSNIHFVGLLEMGKQDIIEGMRE